MRNESIRLLAFLATLALFVPPATADYVPYFIGAPFNYFSTDTKPIEVSLGIPRYDKASGTIKSVRRNSANELVDGPPIAVVRIPRAYIMFANNYTSSRRALPGFRHEILPDRIVTNHLILAVAYPDGSPLSVSYGAFHRNKPNLKLLGRDIDKIRKDKQARSIVLLADISSWSNQNARDSNTLSPRVRSNVPKFVDIVDGFQHFRGIGTGQYYYDNGPDEIRVIKCFGDPATTQPGVYCKYTFPLNDYLLVNLDFLDFRIHGGRDFARERIRAFKKFACPIFRCDEKALEAAEVKG